MAAGVRVLDIETMIRDPDWLGDDQISDAQMGIIKAIHGIPLSAIEMEIFLEITEGRPPAKGGYSEATLICGVRSGKTDKIAANEALYAALVFDPSMLAPGESAYIPVIAQNVEGARTAWAYVEGKARLLEEKGRQALDGGPILDPGMGRTKSVTGKEIRFANRVIVSTFPCNKAGIRGKTCIMGIGDEFAFWDTADTAESSDVEIFRAMRSRMATMRGKGKLIKITSPYAEAGVAYSDYQERKSAKRLFVQAPSWVLNPNLDPHFLAEQQEIDPEAYSREYGAQFGKGGGTYLPGAYVTTAMREDRPETLPRQQGMTYAAWIDVAFKHDLYAFGVAHRMGDRVIYDHIQCWQGSKKNPLDPREIAEALVQPMAHYGLNELRGDQYAAVPVARDLRAVNLHFIEEPETSERAWDAWQNLKRLLRQKAIELPKVDIIRQDLMSLVLVRAGHGTIPKVAAPDRAGFHDDISKVISKLAYQLAPPTGEFNIADWNAAVDTQGHGGYTPSRMERLREKPAEDDLGDIDTDLGFDILNQDF